MDSKTLSLRPAIPTESDSVAFARYLDEAAEGFFRTLLGRRSQPIIANAFLEPGHDLSYENVFFAARDASLLGMVSGYRAADRGGSSLQALRRAAGGWNLRMRILLVVFAPLLRIIDSISLGDFYIQAIAVDADYRGSGVGSSMMDYIEQRGLESGAGRLVLDVSAKNRRAIEFYMKRGYAIESEWPVHLRIPGLRLYRMARTL